MVPEPWQEGEDSWQVHPGRSRARTGGVDGTANEGKHVSEAMNDASEGEGDEGQMAMYVADDKDLVPVFSNRILVSAHGPQLVMDLVFTNEGQDPESVLIKRVAVPVDTAYELALQLLGGAFEFVPEMRGELAKRLEEWQLEDLEKRHEEWEEAHGDA